MEIVHQVVGGFGKASAPKLHTGFLLKTHVNVRSYSKTYYSRFYDGWEEGTSSLLCFVQEKDNVDRLPRGGAVSHKADRGGRKGG